MNTVHIFPQAVDGLLSSLSSLSTLWFGTIIWLTTQIFVDNLLIWFPHSRNPGVLVDLWPGDQDGFTRLNLSFLQNKRSQADR